MGKVNNTAMIIQESSDQDLPIVAAKPEFEQKYAACLYLMRDSANRTLLLRTKPVFYTEKQATDYMEDVFRRIRALRMNVLDEEFPEPRKRRSAKSGKAA